MHYHGNKSPSTQSLSNRLHGNRQTWNYNLNLLHKLRIAFQISQIVSSLVILNLLKSVDEKLIVELFLSPPLTL